MSPRVRLDALERQVLVPATNAAPRNMGADLAVLADGRWLLGYSCWLGGTHDYDASRIRACLSDDDGATWSEPFDVALEGPRPVAGAGAEDTVVEAVRMPCFLRRRDGSLACLARYRTSVLDTWTGMTVCRDEARLGRPGAGADLWSEPLRISPPAPGRHVLLNNRVVRLRQGAHAGRLLLPLASPWPWDEEDARGSDIRCWVLLSDDDGASWRRGDSMLAGPERGLMEPYVVEATDGRLRMWMRTQMSCQFESVSSDGGVTWSPAAPGPLVAPESPVAVARHEASGLLMVVWNHSRKVLHTEDRTPICVAFSADEGDSWFGEQRLDPEKDTGGPAHEPADDGHPRTFSYPSAHFLGDRGIVTYYENAGGPISLILRRFELRVG